MDVKTIKQHYPHLMQGLDEDNLYLETILLDRYHREQNLKDQYVIVRGSKSRGDLYVQNPKLSSKYIWTQFKNNAQSFASKQEAFNYANQHHLGNVRVLKLYA